MSYDCRDFIEKCLDKNPTTRLGSKNDAKELLKHPWLTPINVKSLLKREIDPPFVPAGSILSCFNRELLEQEASLGSEPRKLISTES